MDSSSVSLTANVFGIPLEDARVGAFVVVASFQGRSGVV